MNVAALGRLALATSVLALLPSPDTSGADAGHAPASTACEGLRPPLPSALFFESASGAFPGSERPDVAVHVPPGFDATRRPGVILYFHGWNGCVAAALSDGDAPCVADGPPRPGSRLAAQLDEARVNALLVAVELRADMPTGEPGAMAARGGARALLREVLAERMAGLLGCALTVEAIDRLVVVAHSGGYQAAASAVAFGELPALTEVVLLDALYGADDVFGAWVSDALRDPAGTRRFVDLYTCCGGTLAGSQALAWSAGVAVYDDDVAWTPDVLAPRVVFARVPAAHRELPRAYFRDILQRAGFAPLHA